MVDSWTKYAGYKVDALEKDSRIAHQPGRIPLDSQVDEGVARPIKVNEAQLRLNQVEAE